MKKTFAILFIVVAGFLSACEDELERLPEYSLVEKTTFTTYNNYKLYMWKFYTTFSGFSGWGNDRNEWSGDMMLHGERNTGSNWLWNNITVPSSPNGLYKNSYKAIREINLMLGSLPENNTLTEKEKNHWQSVGLFFRSYHYFQLLKAYGGVIWVDKYINETDDEYLYAPRASRDEIATNILNDLNFAAENVKAGGDGANTVNTNVVKALISRFGLFEGTWRKYHNLGDEGKYLQASKSASEDLLAAYPAIHNNYDDVYNSLDLSSINGIIFYRDYVVGQAVHDLTHWIRTSQAPRRDLTKKAADMFLCADGQTRWNSPMFEGDATPHQEFRNRDRRMLYIICPPYKVKGNVGGDKHKWEHTGEALDREFMDLMASISPEGRKRMPEVNWAGFVQPRQPNFRKGDMPGTYDPGYNVTTTGYKNWKWYNTNHIKFYGNDETDAPIFRIGEVMLNYAEVMYELGSFDQSVADKTINKLRARGHVASMTVADIDANFDPTRNAKVAPVLWEIRRERAVELMCDGFRFDDLRRWKLMEEAAEEKLGRYVVKADYNNVPQIQGNKTEGYVSPYLNQGIPPAFPEHYYLYPLPSQELVLNDKLEQNPGWE
ncbi:starch-binding protein (plasmid) [Fulvitalea axinellae]|uniref:Starch-binding protein n=1 Tax=Fulvitalea axinellae TaxID=1182444 RepID=A0AAU9CQ78_9BACT|nr:starch-binding protein [Fulvitalea axinellae]